MKAWEIARDIVANAKAKLVIESDDDWCMQDAQKHDVDKLKTIWKSIAPGSQAPASLIAGAVGSVENLGKDVSKAEVLLPKGFKALEKNDMQSLFKITSEIFYLLNNAPKCKNADYWKYTIYDNWDDFESKCEFPKYKDVDINNNEVEKKILNGWLGQICGGAFGTALEGYDSKTIKEYFGEVRGYLKKPSTYNDDITYELVLLKTILEKESDVTAFDIANNWTAMIPFGWSAEDIAMKNLMLGVYPPESGYINNPYREWIGAQMRGCVCGMVCPGNPYKAAKLAWLDGQISHHNNGIIGEVFNAVMTAITFVENDIKEIVKIAINMLPKDSQYYSVVNYALKQCQNNDEWEDVLRLCEKEFETYNLVHAFPNAAIEVVALWFGNGDFDKTMHIAGMAGLDVDCNTAQIGNIVAILSDKLNEEWTKPIGNVLNTYVRGISQITLDELVKMTIQASEKLKDF
ncbi:ADP-ribosylglycohydrolase family protein [Abyssisolibacter fermentans]|uniref:ADP-ribosylglycohydrolase family protein n=1 Tax=Abyssisolibacter fermentans TaxID=1766203 RepID=UPI00082A1D69|nr:ADP-ribosylglycohydrolase family protein [Abyssisolibacter fermentans]